MEKKIILWALDGWEKKQTLYNRHYPMYTYKISCACSSLIITETTTKNAKKTKVKNYNITYVILYIVWNTNRVLMCWLYIVLILLLFFLFSFLQYTFCSMVLVLVVVRWMVQKKTFVLMMISLIFYLFNMLFHPRTKWTTNIPNNTQQKKKIKILH